nr:unnamed protein product [Digitaria exilis]
MGKAGAAAAGVGGAAVPAFEETTGVFFLAQRAHQGADDAAGTGGDIVGEAAAIAMDEEAIEPDFATLLAEIDAFLTAYRDGEVFLASRRRRSSAVEQEILRRRELTTHGSPRLLARPAAPRRCMPAPRTTGACWTAAAAALRSRSRRR